MNQNTVQITLQFKDDGTAVVVDQAKSKVQDLNKSVGDSKGPMAAFQEGWVGVTAKLAIASAAVLAVTKGLTSFVGEAAEAEAIENRLKYALETTGYQWSISKTAVDQFANSIQESTRFSDEQARQALTDMMMYTNSFTKAQEGARLAMDMSIRTGQGLEHTSRLIGMAMSGNVEMLGRYIPQLRNLDNVLGSNASLADKAAYSMKNMQEKFGGTAQNDLTTYSGKLAQFKNAWTDLKEEIGGKFLPVLKETFEWLTKTLREMEKRRTAQEGGFFGGMGVSPPGSAYMAPKATAVFKTEEGLPQPERADIYNDALKQKQLELERQKILIDLEMEYAKIVNDIDRQIALTLKIAENEKERLKIDGKLTQDISAQMDKTTRAKIEEFRYTEQTAKILEAQIRSYAAIDEYNEKAISNLNQLNAQDLEIQGKLAEMRQDYDDQLNIIEAILTVKLRMIDADNSLSSLEKQMMKDQAKRLADLQKFNVENKNAWKGVSYEPGPGMGEAEMATSTYNAQKANFELSKQYNELIGNKQKVIELTKQEAEAYASYMITTGQWGEEQANIYKKIVDVKTEQMTDSYKLLTDFGASTANIWSSHLSAMIKGTESFAEGFKEIFADMASYAIEQLTKVAMNAAIFGVGGSSTSITGGLIGALFPSLIGVAEGGLLPGSFIPIKAFAGGGFADRPTLGLIGEGGEREWIIPESKMGRGQTIVNNYVTNVISAMDTVSWLDFCDRNPAGILSVISRDQKVMGITRQ